METRICPNCGCSLVRLGISKDKAVAYRHEGEEYFFCCEPCVDVFKTDPRKYLERLNDTVVCPTCLAEKSLERAVEVIVDGQQVHFCGCPYCVEVFQKDPNFYIKRLEGTISNDGIFDHEGGSVRPE